MATKQPVAVHIPRASDGSVIFVDGLLYPRKVPSQHPITLFAETTMLFNLHVEALWINHLQTTVVECCGHILLAFVFLHQGRSAKRGWKRQLCGTPHGRKPPWFGIWRAVFFLLSREWHREQRPPLLLSFVLASFVLTDI